jgi:hypothetical protein
MVRSVSPSLLPNLNPRFGQKRQPLTAHFPDALIKAFLSLWVYELCARYDNNQVLVQSIDPGFTASPVTSDPVGRVFAAIFYRPPVMGARGIVNGASPIKGAHGAVLLDYDIET